MTATSNTLTATSVLGIIVKFLYFRTPVNFAVIYLKFKQRGQIFEYFVKKMEME